MTLKLKWAAPELLQLMRLLSALESWSFSSNTPLPDYLHGQISSAADVLEREILAGQKETTPKE